MVCWVSAAMVDMVISPISTLKNESCSATCLAGDPVAAWGQRGRPTLDSASCLLHPEFRAWREPYNLQRLIACNWLDFVPSIDAYRSQRDQTWPTCCRVRNTTRASIASRCAMCKPGAAPPAYRWPAAAARASAAAVAPVVSVRRFVCQHRVSPPSGGRATTTAPPPNRVRHTICIKAS